MDEFIDKLLPGNYWITKSMEFSRTNTSGTFWYLKKWFVYYHYVFFKKTIHENEYSEIIEIFDKFIESLDISIQEEANKFFYEVDIKSNFIRMNTFCNINETVFESIREENQSIIEAKKFYFMYLMGIGGQSGYKKKMLELIHSGTVYSEIKRIMTIEMQEDGKDLTYIKSQFSDFHAVIRNERQIFFYYGLFNGSDKADLSGFYTMTRLGKSIILGTFSELTVIWEHQKIKMISQNPDTKIDLGDHIKDPNLNYQNFSINYHPYFTLLKSLAHQGSINKEKYQFLISRFRNYDNIDSLLTESASFPQRIEEVKSKISLFNRNSDIKGEDFHKEYKKYVLGISDLFLDNNTNVFSFLSEDGLEVKNIDKVNFIIKCYEIITKYLDLKNEVNYKSFEEGLKLYYSAQVNNDNFDYSPETIYEWHKYIISQDVAIILSIIYVYSSFKVNKYNFDLTETEIKNSYKGFKNLLEVVGIGKQGDFIENMQQIQIELSTGSLSVIFNIEENEIPTMFDELINESKLSLISTRTSSYSVALRKRSSELINAIKSYYKKNFELPPDNLIMCDACNQKTFKTRGDFAYLEYHHLIPFSTDNGPDHYLNIVGICPTCHRKFHSATRDIRKNLYDDLSENNNLKKTLNVRIDKLYKEGVLEPLNIEFLRKESIISDITYKNYMEQEIVTI